MLLNEDLEEQFTDDCNFIDQYGNLSKKEVIIKELNDAINKIKKMEYKNEKQLKKNDNRCPQCGEKLTRD
jgi:uncharacterized protein with PIN domain